MNEKLIGDKLNFLRFNLRQNINLNFNPRAYKIIIIQRMNILLKVLFLSLLVTYTFSLKGIGLNPIKPYHLNQGKSTSYLFSIAPEQEILLKAKVRITFPYEFDHSRLAANLSCMVRSVSYAWKQTTCIYLDSSVIVDLGQIKDETTYVLVSRPVNPVIYTMSSYFSLCLMYDNTITSCDKQFGKVVFPSPPIPNNGFVTPSVQSLNSNTVGQSSTYQFKFSLSANYDAGNTIRVKFPPGFTTTQSPICQMSGTFNQVIRTFVWPDKRSIECQSINSTFLLNTAQNLKIIGIYNPQYAGNFGNTAQGFIIEILRGTTTISLQQISVPGQISIQTGILLGKIEQDNNFVKSKTRYTFYLNIQNPLTSQDYIQIRFDKSWILYQGQCSVITGLKMGTRDLSCANSTTGLYSYMNISSFDSASVSNQIVLSILVGSPNLPGEYTVQTITGNHFGVMDRMVSQVSLNTTYGTIEMLSINAITANAKVQVGKTGPLQLTFFLNYELPQTNVLTEGKFVMKIYPPIPVPNPATNGVLKCYFFNSIPAKTCNWDNTNVLYTQVTIKTPETDAFQYSQIPITLTTEGAVNDSMIGITIADVVTRYRFELQAYKQQNSVIPTQVYYTEYIADAIPIVVTTYSVTNEMNQNTHLRMQFLGPYTFTNAVVKNIRIKIQFLNSGWAANLGYSANQIYKRFPCVFSQSTQINPPLFNSEVRCDLYTYLQGPHASLTDVGSRGPYLIVYGFHTQLVKNTNYRLEVGKFKIGQISNIQTKLRFSFIEQTPDMLTNYIELYFKEFNVFTTTSSINSMLANQFTTSMTDSRINVANTHTNAFTVSSNAFAIIYEYDQSSTQSFPNQNFLCSTSNWCVSLGYPVNWIIQYRNAGSFPTSISSSFSFTNGIWANPSSFLGKVRVFQSNMTVIYRSTFTYTYTPALPTSCYFDLQDTYGYVYKNMEQYYRFRFYPATSVPSNGFIRYTLSNQMKFSTVPYCQASDINVLDTKLGILCSLEDSRSTLKVYNIGPLTASSLVEIYVRIATQITSAGSISPSVRIRTYQTLDIDNSVVDQKTSQTLAGSAVTNYYSNPISFLIENPRTVKQTPRVGYVGRVQFVLFPSSVAVSTPATQIRVFFHDHPWNGGRWTTPNDNLLDPLVCKINRKRVGCTYTLNPLNILMDIVPAGLNTGSDNIITLDTEFIAPQNGLLHPTQGGQYMTTLHFYNAAMFQLQKTTFTHEIKAIKLRNFVVQSTVHDIGVQNMFQIWFQTWSTLTVNANNNGGTYSRIFIQFPTKDALGNNLFASDLGGYKQTGQHVGCNFYYETGTSYYVRTAVVNDYLKCRLIKSQVQGDPVRVEIINHNAFTSTVRYMRVFIAKVFNPAIAVTSVPITIRIQHVQVSTNKIYEIYHDTYNVFMNSQNPTLQQTNGTRSTRSDSFQDGKDISDQGVFSFDVRKRGSVAIDGTNGYFMAIDLTDDFKPMNNQNTTQPAIYLHSSYYWDCFIFPQINYVIVKAKRDDYYMYLDVKLSAAFSQVTTTLVTRVWQNGRFMGFDHIQITPANLYEIVGGIYSVTWSNVGHSWARAISRRRTQMRVQFRIDNGIPAGGSIEIIWPTGVPQAYPHCRSMISQGSVLYAQGQTYNGQIGCMVQNVRNWVITSFQAIAQNSWIIIVGQIDLPASYHYIGRRYIYTYNNSHASDIRTNGFVIDYIDTTPSDIYIDNSASWNIDSQITVEETLSLRVGYVGPLQFKFQLNENLLGPKAGRMVVRVSKKSTISQANGFTYVDKKYVCKVVHLVTHQQTGCIVQRVDDDNTASNENIKFTMFTSSNLLSSGVYKLVLTTQQGIQPQGLTFPTSPGTYKVSLSVDADSNTNYNIYNHLYIEVYGTAFKTLSIVSMNTLPSEQNLLWIKLTPTTQILATEQIIIEFPTKSTQSPDLVLFSNDLGMGLTDGSDIKVDIIGGTFTNTFMKCRIYLGDSTFRKSVKIVCGQFTQSIEDTQLLFFAIKFVNPALNGGRAHVSLPLFIYSVQQGKTFKKNFNVYDNAVFMRNDVYDRSFVGDITTANLQTQSTSIDMISRNYWDLVSGQYYILFFGFPLRKNGLVTSGCSYPGSSVYGNAYYHQNIWAIVCQITSNTLSGANSGNSNNVYYGNPRNLRITQFYTPWYFLTATERRVMSFSYYTGGITTKGLLTDLFPNAAPKVASSPTFTMTAVHQTVTQYLGSRDDYTFQIIYSSTASNDISYMKLIAIIFPSGENINYVLVGQDCVQATGSQVQIQECWIETGGRIIWIRPVIKTTYISNMKIRIQTRNLAIRNPTGNQTVYWNRFAVKFYSWQNITQPTVAPLSNDNYCFLIINNINGALFSTYAYNPASYSVGTYDYISYPHQRYFEETPYQTFTHRAPLQLKFRPNHDFTSPGANFHNIKILYPSSFGDVAMFKIRDLQVFRPVCYLNNFRIRKCSIDIVSHFISMDFQFTLTNNVVYYIKVSILDPRNSDINGFLASAAISDLVLTYKLAGQAITYYMESDQFPTLFTLPTGVNGGPFRGITAGDVEYGHQIIDQLNSINLVLTFNRTDITGLVFQVPLRDSQGTYLYPTAGKFTAAFMSLQNGATYPCGNNGYSAGGNPKCIILNGDNTKQTVSTKIIMTDFTYNTKMNCRFIFINPETDGAFFSVKVKAYGGTRSETNLYGDKYMGEWDFTDIFKATTGTVDSNTYSRSYYRVPSKSPWRNDTEDYVFAKNYPMYAARMSLARVLLYDSSSSTVDDQFCQARLGSTNFYDDLIEYKIVSAGVTKKFAYFVRTWQATSNLTVTQGTGWTLQFIKCKYYIQSYMAYLFFEKNSIQVATNTHSLSYPGTYGTITSPTVMYFDQTRRFSDGTATSFIMQIDFTSTINTASSLQFRSQDAMVLLITILDNAFWNDITNCQLLGGIISTSEQSPAYCERHSSNQIRIRNIAGFDSDPLLDVSKNKRVKFLFKVTSLIGQESSSDPTKYTYTYLYANFDAINNGYQPIFSKQSSFINNCHYPNQYCYYAYGAGSGSGGYFSLDSLSDTAIRVAFKPYTYLNFASTASYDHHFRLQFHGFGFGSCSISSVTAQISTSTTPGTGTNNTLDFDTKSCANNHITISWTADRIFADNWGRQGLAINGQWTTSWFIILYIIVAPGVQDLTVMHHDYIFMSGTYNYWPGSGSTQYDAVRGTSYLPIQSLAGSGTVATLTDTREAVSELILQVKSLALDIGSTNTNYILLAEFIGTNSWNGANDPFRSYTNPLKSKEKIQCKCLSGVGPLSSSTTSPFVDAKCYRRLPGTVGSGTFNNFAITIDHAAFKTNDIKCYFPEFFITAGMSLTIKFKTIFGDNYPVDLISGTTEYGSMYSITSNVLSFAGSTPSMNNPYVYGWNSLSDNLYSAAITVGTKVSGIYSLTGDWNATLSSPYLYLNLFKAGPIPVFTFCSDSNVYFQCRVYSKLINVVVARIKSSSSGSFSMTQGSDDLYYPFSQSSQSSFDGFAYVGTTSWNRIRTFSRTKSNLAPISNNKFSVFTDKYGSSRFNYITNILISMNTNGKTLSNYGLTGSKIEVSFSSVTITHLSNCQVWVQNQMNIQLTCEVTSGLITIYSRFYDFTTTNNIFVSLGITNPSSASVTFTMKMYDYFYSATRFSMMISRTAIYTTDLTYSSLSQLQKSRLTVYPFKSKISMTSNSPLRIQFSLPSSPGSISFTGNGLFLITNSQFAYTSSYLCYFKEYTSYTNMMQQTDYKPLQSICSVSSSTLSIYPPKTATINHANFYELIVMPIGITSTGCNLGGNGCFNQAGFHQANFEEINFITYQNTVSGPSIAAQQVNKRYMYEGSTRIGLQHIYLLCAEPNVETSLYIAFNIDFSSLVNFPDHYIQLTFFDLLQSSFVGYVLNDNIPCQLSDNFLSIANRKSPQCKLASSDPSNNVIKIRIQNIGNLAVGNYWLSLDDIVLPVVSGGDSTKKFDIAIAYFRPGTNTKHQNLFKEIFVLDGTNATNPTTITGLSFANPSSTVYGAPVSGVLSFTWPFDTSLSDYESKITVNINGGFAASWSDINTLTFTDPSLGSYLLLWVNKKLNKFVFKIPNKSSGTATMTINNLKNPFPYQRESYNLATNIQMNVYNKYFAQATQTVSQPAFTVYQKNPSIIYINQNVPTNTLDNFPTTEKTTANGLSKLILSVAFDQTTPNIVLRKLDHIDIKFTSGLTYIQDCRAVRNNSLFVNELTTCQTFYDGTFWHIKLYDITNSQLDVDWWLHVFAKFTSATLAYTFQIMPKNLVVQYETSYSVTLSGYDATKIIPTQLSWLNRKYVSWYFQNQVKLLQAVTGKTTPYFKFRFNLPIAFDGAYDKLYFYLPGEAGTQPFRSKSQTSNLICNFLPSNSVQRDFAVGYYSPCTLQDIGSTLRFVAEYVHGGLPLGNYLLQIAETNMIATEFYFPTTPTRTQIQTQLYRSESGTNHYDSFFIQSYRYFRKAEITHTTTTVQDYDSLRITYIPQGGLSAYSTNREIVLRLSVHAQYMDTTDGGIKSIYLDDGVNIFTGHRFSEVVSNPNGNQVTTIQFSQYSNNMSPLRFNLARQSAYTDNVQYVWRLPLLQNPNTSYVSLRYNLSLIEYPSSTTYGIIFNHYQIINDYFTEPDTSVSFTTAVTNNLRQVQTTAGVDLSINLGIDSVPQWDSVTFKLDNTKKGLIPSFSNCNDTSNYNYYYFHTLQMVWAQKKTSVVNYNVGINALSSTQKFQSNFAFKWVKILDSSSTKERFNPITKKFSTPPTLTLSSFNSYSAATLTLTQGYETQASTTYYKLLVTTKIIPSQGQIRILFDETKFSANIIGSCRVGTGFVKATSYKNVLRCYRGLNGLIVAGFNAITAATSLQVFFYLKSLTLVTSSDITVDIYGVFRDNSTRISRAVVQALTHTTASFPTNLQRIQQTVTPYYRSWYSYYGRNNYYQLEGSFVLRASNIAGSSSSIFITDPAFQAWGTRRLLVKKNVSTVTGWTQMQSPSCSSSRCRWYLPDNYINTLTFQVGFQYIWRYSIQFFSSRQNGFYFQASGTQRFLLQVHTGSVYSQLGYEEFIPKNRPIQYTLTNRYLAAGRQTLLDMYFLVDIDIATSDQIEFTFDTNNLLYDMFEKDLEGNSTNQAYRYLDCRQWVTTNDVSGSRIVCLLYFGDRAADPPKPAKLSIRTTKGFDGYPNNYYMRVLIANVKNPTKQNLNTGVELNINRNCINSHNQSCSYYTARDWFVTKSSTQNYYNTGASFSSNGNIVLQGSRTHAFTIPLTSSLTTSGIIFIVYPQNYQGVMPSDCSADNSFTCVSFPTRRWIVLYPGTTYTTSVTVNIWYMTNGYYSQAFDNKFKITVGRPTVIGDVYYVTAATLAPITSGISMTISATQTPQVWLRNYANTAIFYINNIFLDDRIKAIYIKAPTQVTRWTDNYCNASITSTLINTYPLRFECKVDQTDPDYLKITRHSQQTTWSASWPSYTIKVHAKFKLQNFEANQPILYQTLSNTSNPFFAYGSVNINSPISKYYLSQTSNTVSISQHQVPIISEITFNQKSFAYRVARVNNKEVFYLLLKPTVGISQTIGQMVFKIPDQFDYPGVFAHDYCFLLGRTKQDQTQCKQSREAGQTLIKLKPTNYDQEVKIIQLGSKLSANWFTAPQLPGDFYNMTVELYSPASVLLQKQTINISPVYGQYFNIPSINLQNILQTAYTQSVYDLTFVTGTLQIPPGAKTTATSLTSQLQFVFENYNAANATNVFANDLRTGLKQGSQVGCLIRQGIKALQNMRIMCLLHLGTNSTDKPTIRIINYDFINPGTIIKVSFGAIQSLAAPLSNTISLGVKMYYNDAKNSSTFLYILTPVLPTPTIATSLDTTRLSGWAWNFWHSFSGANVVLQPTSFTLSMTVPYSYPDYWPYTYTSTSQQHQFILMKFSPKWIIDPYNKVAITCAQCSQIQIFYATGIIRFRHARSMAGSGTYNFNFLNFPTSSYAVVNQSVSVAIEVYQNYRRIGWKTTALLNRTVQKCTKFGFGVLSVSSLNGGQVQVEYLFSIKTNHYIPPYGAISISLPQQYGNLVSNAAVCTLIGFQDTNVYCRIDTPSRVDIYLNGTELSQSYSYKISVNGIQNPNSNSSNLHFIVSSYFTNNIYQNKKICENQITPPSINVKSIRQCTLEWQPDFSNMYFNATYSFYVSCSDQFRGSSIVYIKLPSEFGLRNKEGEKICSSYQSTTLVNNSCTLKYINGSLMLYTSLDATSQTSFSIITNFVNPVNNTYSVQAFIMSKGVTYAKTSLQSLRILSNSYSTAKSSDIFLLNNPKEGGLMATYIFKMTPIKTFSPDNIAFTFPSNFYLDQTELNIGLCVSDVSNLFQQLTYNNIQMLINNISAVSRVSLKLYPTFQVSGNTIFVKNITNQLSSTLWTYILIRGVKNPSKYQSTNFTISYYIETVEYKALQWIYNYPLKYFISPPPNFLTMQKVEVSDYDILYPSKYTFTFSSTNNNQVGIAGKKLSYVIVLPTFYRSTLWANTAPVCKFDSLATNSTCYSYESQIIITETFTVNSSKLVLSISNILNPSLETFCNTTDVTLLSHTFFKIRIIQVESNAFLYESSAVVDSSNCLKFTSLRIPITLEYSLIMVAGLTYNITYGLTRPASNLKINAYIQSQTGFTFSPTMVQFNDYYTLRNSTALYLRSDIAAGKYTINFNKYESQIKTYFRNILPITITVIKADQSSLTRPTISINSMTISTIGYQVDIPVTFSMPSSTQMTLFMTISEQQNQTLEQYNSAFKDFSIAPRIINIKPQAASYSFKFQHMQRKVPPPLTLDFKLTSLYPIIHNLTTSRLYVCFDQDPKFDVLQPPMRIRITPFIEACNNKDIGKSITNIYSKDYSASQSITVKSVLPVIIKIETTQIASTSAKLQVSLDAGATVFYICMPSGYPAITDKALIKSMKSTVGITGSSSSGPMSVYSGAASQINFKSIIELTRLSPTSDYDIYVMSESTLGQSSIMKKQFKTTDISKGIVMKLAFKDIIESLTIVKALQRILRISPVRIKVLTSTYELQLLKNTIGSDKNVPYYIYEVVIAPDPQNDVKSPEQIVTGFVDNSISKQQLKTQIPLWANLAPISYYQLRVNKPKVLQMPKPLKIFTYNCSFVIKMWEKSNIYAILIEEEGKANNTLTLVEKPIVPVRVSTLNVSERAKVPSSNQIRSGLNKNNAALNKYRYYSGTTNYDKLGTIFFDDLQPGTKYVMYITSSSILPYEPTYLWQDSEVIRLDFTTLYNQALHNQVINTNQLKKYNPSLAAAIERFQKNQDKKDDFSKLTKA